ncbi:MAG TPA: hypothetical protein VMS31_17340 [Pyrinomonadaceae bacterium]|nr:hypothetical protein [Pyrinomonadaceae bacterium]
MQISRALLIALLLGVAPGSFPQTTSTVINDRAAAVQLVGKHKFQLHWLSWGKWKDLGELVVINRQGTLSFKARQARGADYVEIEGTVLKVETKEFTFRGRIVTRVSYKNEGKPCERNGEMTFKITGKRRYWRLVEMQSPCDETTDYVDIFLR